MCKRNVEGHSATRRELGARQAAAPENGVCEHSFLRAPELGEGFALELMISSYKKKLLKGGRERG